MAAGQRVVVIASWARSLVNFRLQLLEALTAAGCEVVALAPEDDTEVRAALAAVGVRYETVPLQRTGMNPMRDGVTLLALARRLRRLQPDAVLAYTIKPVIYGLLASRAVPRARRYAMITGLGYAFSDAAGGLTRAVTALYRLALAGADAVLFQNPDDRALFEARGVTRPEQGVRIHGSGVDTRHFQPTPPVTEPISFLLIARLLRDKGVREYAEAARLLRARHPGVRCVLVGPLDANPSAVTPEELAAWQRDGAVEYLGEQRDVRPFLASCSAYVLPSYREGTPRTVLEAMAMARPVITTDAPGCRETVEEGVNGFLVPVRDPRALAAAMERFVERPELVAEMGRASRRLAQERYDVHAVNRTILRAMRVPQTQTQTQPQPQTRTHAGSGSDDRAAAGAGTDDGTGSGTGGTGAGGTGAGGNGAGGNGAGGNGAGGGA